MSEHVTSSCHESADPPLPWWDLRGRGSSLIRFGLAHRCSRALPFLLCLHMSPRIVTVRHIHQFSRISGFGVALPCYHVIFVIARLTVLLTWYLVSHDGLVLCTDLSPCLLMLQGVLSRSIPHSCCTRIAVLTLVDDY